MSTSTFDDGSSTSSSYLMTPSPMVQYPRGNRVERRKLANLKPKKNKEEPEKKEKEKDATALLVESLQSSLDNLDRFLHTNLQDEIFLARKDMMPRHFEKSEKLRSRWRKLERDLVYEELLVTISDAKEKKRCRTKEAFKRELYCLLKTGSNPLTPIGEEPENKGPTNSERLSPEGASYNDNDVEQSKSRKGKESMKSTSTKAKGKSTNSRPVKSDKIQITADIHAVPGQINTQEKAVNQTTNFKDGKKLPNGQKHKSLVEQIMERQKQSKVAEESTKKESKYDGMSSTSADVEPESIHTSIQSQKRDSIKSQTSNQSACAINGCPTTDENKLKLESTVVKACTMPVTIAKLDVESVVTKDGGKDDKKKADNNEAEEEEEDDDGDDDNDEDDEDEEEEETDEEETGEEETDKEDTDENERELLTDPKLRGEKESAQNAVSERDSVSQSRSNETNRFSSTTDNETSRTEYRPCTGGRDTADTSKDNTSKTARNPEETNASLSKEDEDDEDEEEDEYEDDEEEEEEDDEEEDDEEEDDEEFDYTADNKNHLPAGRKESVKTEAKIERSQLEKNVKLERKSKKIEDTKEEIQTESEVKHIRVKDERIVKSTANVPTQDSIPKRKRNEEIQSKTHIEVKENIKDEMTRRPTVIAKTTTSKPYPEYINQKVKKSSKGPDLRKVTADTKTEGVRIQSNGIHMNKRIDSVAGQKNPVGYNLTHFGIVVDNAMAEKNKHTRGRVSCSRDTGGKEEYVTEAAVDSQIGRQNERKKSSTPDTLISDGGVYIHRTKTKKKDVPPSTPHSRQGKRQKKKAVNAAEAPAKVENPQYEQNPYIASANDIRKRINSKESERKAKESSKHATNKRAKSTTTIPKMFKLVTELRAKVLPGESTGKHRSGDTTPTHKPKKEKRSRSQSTRKRETSRERYLRETEEFRNVRYAEEFERRKGRIDPPRPLVDEDCQLDRDVYRPVAHGREGYILVEDSSHGVGRAEPQEYNGSEKTCTKGRRDDYSNGALKSNKQTINGEQATSGGHTTARQTRLDDGDICTYNDNRSSHNQTSKESRPRVRSTKTSSGASDTRSSESSYQSHDSYNASNARLEFRQRRLKPSREMVLRNKEVEEVYASRMRLENKRAERVRQVLGEERMEEDRARRNKSKRQDSEKKKKNMKRAL